MHRSIAVLWLVLALVNAWGSAATTAEKPDAVKDKPKAALSKDDYYELFKVLADTVDQVERNYVKEVDRRELIEAAIQGMLTKLDPYSGYIGPSDLSSFRTSVENEFGGIGIQVTMDKGLLQVLSPLVGTPAYRAGLMAGDRILEVDGQSTAGMKLDDAIRHLKGVAGTRVTLTILHPGSGERKKVEITREVIHVDTVMGDHRDADDQWDFMLDHDKRIGYIRVSSFSRDTAQDLRKAIKEIKQKNARGLVLDLRFNPGGLLNSAIEVCDLFISKGRIVSTSGRNSPERIWDARGKAVFEGAPMVVLVNRYSASASEIVSACLQDHQRAVIVGERTWGKGSVQNVVELEGGKSVLKLTTARYVRPSGKNIDRPSSPKDSDEWGVAPNPGYELKLDDREWERFAVDRRKRDIVKPHQPAAVATEPAKTSTQPVPDGGTKKSDNQPPPAKPASPEKSSTPKTPASSEKPSSSGKPAMPEKATTPEKPATAKPEEKATAADSGEQEKEPFVDRQLQMALTYLSGELARAESK